MNLDYRLALLRRPLAVWLALLIAVLGAMMPTLSRAMFAANAGTKPGFVVCTQTGPRWVALADAPESPAERDSALNIEHCPFCMHATHGLAPPPNVSLHDFGVLGEPVVPVLGQAFLFIYQPASMPPPRGPPLVETLLHR